jgi:hypothetical protein
MAILAAMLNGGTRPEHDFYETPVSATLALLPLIATWPKQIWNPACGAGAISKVLERAGYTVKSSDLVDRGYGVVQDFFDVRSPCTPSIVTNPPFERARELILYAHAIGVERMALLLKADFFSSKKSLAVFETWRPRIIAPLTWRLDFTGAGAPHTNCQWVIWNGLNLHHPTFQLLRKPSGETRDEQNLGRVQQRRADLDRGGSRFGRRLLQRESRQVQAARSKDPGAKNGGRDEEAKGACEKGGQEDQGRNVEAKAKAS